MRKILAALIYVTLGTPLALAQSTINPNIPTQNSPLNSAPVRGNFAAAYNDVNGLLQMHAATIIGNCPSTPTVGEDCLVSGVPYTWYKWSPAGNWSAIGTLNAGTGVFSPTLPLGTNTSLGAVRCDGVTINCTSGIITAVGAAASSIGVGTTTIAAGTSKGLLFNNGTLGDTMTSLSASSGIYPILNMGSSATIPTNLGYGTHADFQLVGADSDQNSQFQINGVTSSGDSTPGIFLASYGNTTASPSSLAAGNLLGNVSFFGYVGGTGGYEGTDYANGATFDCYATQNWSTTQAGTACQILTTANGGLTYAVAATFGQDQSLTVAGIIKTPTISSPTISLGTGGGATATVLASSTATGFENAYEIANSGDHTNSQTQAAYEATLTESGCTNCFLVNAVGGGTNPAAIIETGSGLSGGLTITTNGGGTLSVVAPTLSGAVNVNGASGGGAASKYVCTDSSGTIVVQAGAC